ncbi:unnamed protein product [Gadus morhua 'NCC']
MEVSSCKTRRWGVLWDSVQHSDPVGGCSYHVQYSTLTLWVAAPTMSSTARRVILLMMEMVHLSQALMKSVTVVEVEVVVVIVEVVIVEVVVMEMVVVVMEV